MADRAGRNTLLPRVQTAPHWKYPRRCPEILADYCPRTRRSCGRKTKVWTWGSRNIPWSSQWDSWGDLESLSSWIYHTHCTWRVFSIDSSKGPVHAVLRSLTRRGTPGSFALPVRSLHTRARVSQRACTDSLRPLRVRWLALCRLFQGTLYDPTECRSSQYLRWDTVLCYAHLIDIEAT